MWTDNRIPVRFEQTIIAFLEVRISKCFRQLNVVCCETADTKKGNIYE